MTHPRQRITGRVWQRITARVLAASDVCHICGHSGATTADHLVPLARGGTNDLDNLKPAHHDACGTCGRTCNRSKGAKPWAPIVRDSGSIQRPR